MSPSAIRCGEKLGLVGESGCGKSSTGKTILKLLQPTAGIIRLRGVDITPLGDAQMRPYRRDMQIVFQDPYSSLKPAWPPEPAEGAITQICLLMANRPARPPAAATGGARPPPQRPSALPAFQSCSGSSGRTD
jgi:ABC-type oligopeptide transport system ATPase subunit